MEGERILKSLLNAETDDLYEDTKNYLAPLRSPLKNKNGCKVGCKVAEETVSKYTVFATKFLRCAIETLKKVKAKGNNLDEVTKSLNLVGTLLNETLSIQNGTYLKFIPSLDQLGKTLYLIIAQLIAKTQFDKALCHANDLLKFIQLLKTWKNYDGNKMNKDLATLAMRASDALLQGAGKLEEVKVPPAKKVSHLCIILDWRRLSLLFQVEAITHSSLKSLVDRTLQCGTKYQMDCGQKNVNFKTLACFFESVFNALMTKSEQLIANGRDSMLLLIVELGFHYGRICCKAERSTQALDVFDNLLEIARNGYNFVELCYEYDIANSRLSKQMLLESNRLVSQLVKCKMLPSSMLKLLSDSMEYFRLTVQNVCSKQTGDKTPALSWRTFQEAAHLLKLHAAVLSLQCEQIKTALRKANNDDLVAQCRQQLQKTTVRQLTVLSFVISSFQDQMKCEKNAKDCNQDVRSHIIRDCVTVAQQASTVIHSALEDPDVPLSPNELRWLGSTVYNVGCVSYQRDCFAEGVPLLALACDELKIWSFAAETDDKIVTRIAEVKLLTKYALLTDCQRRAKQLSDALKTATTQVLITLRTTTDDDTIRQQVKQWISVKHELVKNLQDEEKLPERSRTLCSAFAEQEDATDVVGSQLCLVLQEELACYKAKSYDTAVEQISVIKQLMELYIVHEDEFDYGSAMLELGVALHSLRDADLGEDKSALEYCQEAGTILEQLSDRVANEYEEENFQSSVVQDRLAAAYLWQALLEHKDVMEEKPASATATLSDSYEVEEMEGVCLEQPFVSSLHSALQTWTVLRDKSVQQDSNGKIDLQHFANPEETYHYLLITAAMFGLLNQPFKKVCALYFAGSISQAVGTNDILDSGLSAYSDAIHSLCDMLDIPHASLLLRYASNLVDSFEPSNISRVQFLLAKSHYLLVMGKYSEGEECLKEALQNEVFTHKSYKTHLLKARFKSICMKYSMLPTKPHEFTSAFDPVLGSLTALECATDGLNKLSQMAEEIFGLDIFSSGKQKHNENEPANGLVISTSSSQSLFKLSLLHDLLSSLLQVGQLYAHQGAVREAFRQFVDGIALASQFSLSYRIVEFLVNIAQLEVMQGKADKCQHRLDQLTGIFQPVLKSSSKPKLFKEGIQQPLFIEHPDTCECVICLDAVLHMIFIDYLASLSNYLTSVSRPEQSSQALEMAELVCESAESKMIRTLGKLNAILCGSEVPRDCSSKETKKKRGTNSAKAESKKKIWLSQNLLIHS
ncbi:Separin [Desmophyllum pertusum]|uniref:Separin n=1 Tax=Desmophyllum pertusum TaxID=174260 RepID=A0A9W9ZFP5_9CNID|nr:Separin [Desmophyllum pertusum]